MAGCGPASHNFRPHNGVLYCKLCGEVRPLAPVISVAEAPYPYRYEGPQTAELPPNAPAVPEDLERSVQDLEADVLERLRDGLGKESWSSIMQRAGIDPSSDFARSLSAKVGAQQAAFEFEPKPAGLGFRASVTGLPPEEQALIEESNRHEQRRVIVDDGGLNAGL